MWKKASCHDSLARYTEKHLMELTYMLFFPLSNKVSVVGECKKAFFLKKDPVEKS